MRPSRFYPLGVFTFAVVALGSSLAHAASCSVSGSTAASLGNYDPFSSAGLTNIPFTLTLTRPDTKTGAVDLDFFSGPSSYSIASSGVSVVAASTNSPLLNTTTPPSGTISVNWVGNNLTQTLNLTASVPAGLNLAPGINSYTFDIQYLCAGQGGNSNSNNPTTLPNAFTGQLTVLSALQASYVGIPFDFGPNAASGLALSGKVRVASTGPFSIAVGSGSGVYAMTYSGGNTGVADQRIRYSVSFLGETADNATSFTTVNCAAATAAGENLSISATLEESGTSANGKVAAPDYADYITVTVSPLVSAVNQQSCPTLGAAKG